MASERRTNALALSLTSRGSFWNSQPRHDSEWEVLSQSSAAKRASIESVCRARRYAVAADVRPDHLPAQARRIRLTLGESNGEALPQSSNTAQGV
jgi:hypothetical protein